MNGRILTCVYCGMEYPQDTPASGDKVLTDHIRSCPKHPLSAAEEKIKKLRAALVGIVGSDKKEELEEMENTVRTFMLTGNVPQKDAVNSINAIHAILETMEESIPEKKTELK